MILGFGLQPVYLIAGGLGVGVLVIVTMLVGLRKIKFKGRRHLRVHKALAWMVLVLGAVHGMLALVYLQDWEILS